MEVEKIKSLITNLVIQSGYSLNEYSDAISFNIGEDTLKQNDTIFVKFFQQLNDDKASKNIIVFSGFGFPFNPLSESEKLKAISLLRANVTMRTNGYWGIEYGYGTYWVTYFVDIYEDGLNIETFQATISTLLSAKESLEKIIEKPFHIN